MTERELREILGELWERKRSVEQVLQSLGGWPSEDLGYARLDHQRALRCGFPEVVLGLGKSAEQFAAIFSCLAARGHNVLATRVAPDAAALVRREHPLAEHDPTARTLTLRQRTIAIGSKPIAIVSAGTADLPVAEEARRTAEIMDQPVLRIYDCGVAGLHRLFEHLPALRACAAIVVVAGMEGALPSVVSGLVDVPVVAVPTSVGYGAHLGGITPLLAMLTSCAAGVSVVNIDNGFGAAYQAVLIGRQSQSAIRDDAE